MFRVPEWLAQSVGETVNVLEGPFEGFACTLHAIDEDGLGADVLMLMFGQWVVTRLPIENLLPVTEQPRKRRSRELNRSETGLQRMERQLRDLETRGLYRFDATGVGKHDLFVRRNWVWMRGRVNREQLTKVYGVEAEFLCGLWFVRCPVLMLTRDVLRRANQGADCVTPEEYHRALLDGQRRHRRDFLWNLLCRGEPYRGPAWRPSAVLRAAEAPDRDDLVHALRRGFVEPIKTIFQPTPLGDEQNGLPYYLAVPLLPEQALREQLARPWSWGYVTRREQLVEVIRREPATS